MKLKIKNNILKVKKVSEFGKISGLMFKSRRKSVPLLFEFSKPTKLSIHSFFVFFPFVAVWLDGDNKIIEVRIVEPFSLSIAPKREFRRLIEIPINQNYQEICEILVEQKV
jgi:uncharacterized membrane protein (UPF0127 family)